MNDACRKITDGVSNEEWYVRARSTWTYCSRPEPLLDSQYLALPEAISPKQLNFEYQDHYDYLSLVLKQ